VGISAKGAEALDKIRKGLVEEHIFNVDYEDAKGRLSRDFEKASFGTKGTDHAFSSFIYHAQPSLLNLNSINKCARDIRAFIKARDTSSFFPNPAYSSREQSEEEKKIVENWDYYAVEAEKFVRDFETWAFIVPLFKEVKQYIVKGRKPIERPPGYEPRVYVPPMPGAQAVSLVKAKLEEIVEAQRAGLVDGITERTVASLSKFSGTGTYDDIKKFLHSVHLEDYFSIAFESAAVDFATRNTYALKKNYQESVRSSVERGVQDMVERYVYKNTRKIAPIVHAKGEPSEVRVGWGSLQGWGFAGSIYFKFPDGTAFMVRNKAVWKSTYSGKLFYQFPTTFHDVTFKDGHGRAMVSEKEMNEVWAKEV
jgi:hypothetical protein